MTVGGSSGPETHQAALAAARAATRVFLQLTPARAEQDSIRASTYGGPLAGVPFAVKDVFDIAGTRTSGASQFLDHRPHARKDAEAVRRISRAGAICIGKTTLSELAYSGLGVNDRFGTPTLHRDGLDRIVGGSSSGSAAAVQAGIVRLALGSDTSGSARIPAAWAGIFGYRPSLGRYADEGMVSLAPTLDTVGILAADAATLLTTDAVLARDPGPLEDNGPPAFVLPHDEYLEGCDDGVLERFHATVDRLRVHGCRIVGRRIESLDLTRTIHAKQLPIVEEEALAAYGRHVEQRPEQFGASFRRRIERARSRARERPAGPLRAAMPGLRAKFRSELDGAILISPPVEIDAPPLQQVRSSPEAEDALNARALRLTMALSYLDSPSAVLPVHFDPQAGVPFATVQLSATAGDDRRLLAAVAHLDGYCLSRPSRGDLTTTRREVR